MSTLSIHLLHPPTQTPPTLGKKKPSWLDSMIGFQVVNLLLEKLRPKILADELDGLKMIAKSRPLHGLPVRKTIIYLP